MTTSLSFPKNNPPSANQPQPKTESPFKGLKIEGTAVKPGLFLFKPGAGLVVVSGASAFTIAGQSMVAITLSDMRREDTHYRTPASQLAKQVRLPSNGDKALEALKKLSEKHAGAHGKWNKVLIGLQDALKKGDPVELADALARVLHSPRQKDTLYTDVYSDLNDSERREFDPALQILADDLSFAIDYKDRLPIDIIKTLLTADQKTCKGILHTLEANKRDINLHMSDKKFRSLFNQSKSDTAVGAQTIQSDSTLPPPSRPSSRAAYRISAAAAAKARENNRPRSKAEGPESPGRKADIPDHNYSFYKAHTGDISAKGPVRGLFNAAAHHLGREAFELYVRVHLLPAKTPLEAVANDMKIIMEQAVQVHDEAVDALSKHVGRYKNLAPSYLKKVSPH